MLDDTKINDLTILEKNLQELKWASSAHSQEFSRLMRTIAIDFEKETTRRILLAKDIDKLGAEVAKSLGLDKFWHWSDHPILATIDSFREKWANN